VRGYFYTGEHGRTSPTVHKSQGVRRKKEKHCSGDTSLRGEEWRTTTTSFMAGYVPLPADSIATFPKNHRFGQNTWQENCA
jgi:hypothetical protein